MSQYKDTECQPDFQNLFQSWFLKSGKCCVLQVHIVQRGAVRPLIRMLEATDPQLREMAAFALGRLAQVLTTAAALVSELAEFLVFLSL
jgi:hypothetical protein